MRLQGQRRPSDARLPASGAPAGQQAVSAARAPPSVPLTQSTSPGSAPRRVTGRPARPITVTSRSQQSAAVRSPPSTTPPAACTASATPPMSVAASSSVAEAGMPRLTVTPTAAAPSAARSLSAPAAARQPISSRASQSRRKWRPSMERSVLTTRSPGAAGMMAQSSPMARASRPRRERMRRMRSNSGPGASGIIGRRPGGSAPGRRGWPPRGSPRRAPGR